MQAETPSAARGWRPGGHAGACGQRVIFPYSPLRTLRALPRLGFDSDASGVTHARREGNRAARLRVQRILPVRGLPCPPSAAQNDASAGSRTEHRTGDMCRSMRSVGPCPTTSPVTSLWSAKCPRESAERGCGREAPSSVFVGQGTFGHVSRSSKQSPAYRPTRHCHSSDLLKQRSTPSSLHGARLGGSSPTCAADQPPSRTMSSPFK